VESTSGILALLSLLHEPAELNCISRRFREKPVLEWTLRRVRRCAGIAAIGILCWDDQFAQAQAIARDTRAELITEGPRRRIPAIDAISAARRWADGWRGGPLGSSAFDPGFSAPAVRRVMEQLQAESVLLIDPASALVDPALLAAVIEQHRVKPSAEFTFTPAATGLGGMLLTRTLVDRLATAHAHPGRVLHYFPDQVSREPIAQDNCAPTPTTVARSPFRYDLSSRRQIERMEAATADLNGELIGSPAEGVVQRMTTFQAHSSVPRDVVLELTVRRATRPIFGAAGPLRPPGASQPRPEKGQAAVALPVVIDRPDLNRDVARQLIDELSQLDDSRLTLAGVGDPLLHADCMDIIAYAVDRGVAVNVETDLLPASADVVARLADSPADVVSIHLPALTPDTYAAVMNVDAYAAVLANLQTLVARRSAAGRATPLIIPLFTKCRRNLHEMEAWYDQWLRAVGTAVILGPTTFAGLIGDEAVADMSPPLRVPCRRLADRITVLCDGSYVTCEQDVFARQPVGRVGQTALEEIWGTRFPRVRKYEADNRWNDLPVCATCKEWHRP